MRKMNLTIPALLLLIAAFLLCLVAFKPVRGWFGWFLALAAFILTAIAAMLIYNWLAWQATERVRARAEAAAITPDLRLMEERITYARVVRSIDPTVAEALKTCPALWDVLSGLPEAAIVMRTSEGSVTMDTVSEWLAGSPDETAETMPVRRCTRDQEAGYLVNHLVQAGFLERARGNQPARWAYAGARERAIRYVTNKFVRLEVEA